MADEPTQYILSVQRMMTSPEADMVIGWSAVVAEKNLPNIVLTDAAKITELALRDCPIPDLRPMTEAEIDAWRKSQ